MERLPTIAAMRAARAGRARVVCVPTMGNLHAGHIALIRHARECGDYVVATIFVNRLQFGPNEDFARYPRTFEADCAQLAAAGCDAVFAPDEAALYPDPQTYRVDPTPELADILEGEFRPGFFRGVATVVTKLFNIVQPDTAIFGKKDYQQLIVIGNMVRQLAQPVVIVAHETARAEDGLALASRNGYLSAAERAQAPLLYRELKTCVDALTQGDRQFEALESGAMQRLVTAGWRPDYIAIRRQSDLAPPAPGDQALVIVGAARIGSTRLIDNLEVALQAPK